MGNIVNPVSYRLGWSRYWSNTWSLAVFTNTKYSFLMNQDYNFTLYLRCLFLQTVSLYFILSRIQVIRDCKRNYVIINYYSPMLEYIMDDIQWLCFAYEKQPLRYQKSILTEDDYLETSTPPRLCFRDFRPDLTDQETVVLKDAIKTVKKNFLRNYRLSPKFFSHALYIAIKRYFESKITKVARYLLNRYLTIYTKKPLSFFFIRCTIFHLNAVGLAAFLRDKFKTYSTLGQVMRSAFYILRRLKDYGNISGYKILYKGRFYRLGRRGRASYKWFRDGGMPLNSVDGPISYASLRVRLKYSTCGIKLWLLHEKDTTWEEEIVVRHNSDLPKHFV